RIQVDVSDEAAIDLHEVAGQFLQVIERGVTGAEVIECNARAERLDLVDETTGRVQVIERNALRHLETHPLRGIWMISNQRNRVLKELLVVQRCSAQVDRAEANDLAV